MGAHGIKRQCTKCGNLTWSDTGICKPCRQGAAPEKEVEVKPVKSDAHPWQHSTDAEIMSHLASFIRICCEDEQRHGEVTVYRRGAREFNQLERMYQ